MKKIFCLLFTFYATTLFTIQLTPDDFESLQYVAISQNLLELVQVISDLKTQNTNDSIFELLQEQNPSLIKLIIYLFERLTEGSLTKIQGFNDRTFIACDCINKIDRVFFALTTILQTIQTIGKESFEYVSLGSGLLLQDYIILSAYKDLEINCMSIRLIDPIYSGDMTVTLDEKLYQFHEPKIEHLQEQFPDKLITTYTSVEVYKPSELANKVIVMSDPDVKQLVNMMIDFKKLQGHKVSQNTIVAMISKNGIETKLITSLTVNGEQALLVTKDCLFCSS